MYKRSSQLLDKINRRDGLMGGCVLHRQQALCTLLNPELTAYTLALLQPTQSKTYTEEDSRRVSKPTNKPKIGSTRNHRTCLRALMGGCVVPSGTFFFVIHFC